MAINSKLFKWFGVWKAKELNERDIEAIEGSKSREGVDGKAGEKGIGVTFGDWRA